MPYQARSIHSIDALKTMNNFTNADGSRIGSLFFQTISQNRFSWDQQTWHRNVPRWVLKSFILGSKVKGHVSDGLQTEHYITVIRCCVRSHAGFFPRCNAPPHKQLPPSFPCVSHHIRLPLDAGYSPACFLRFCECRPFLVVVVMKLIDLCGRCCSVECVKWRRFSWWPSPDPK